MEKGKLFKNMLDNELTDSNESLNFIKNSIQTEKLTYSLINKDDYLGRNLLGNLLVDGSGNIIWANKRAYTLLKINTTRPIKHISDVWKSKDLNRLKRILASPGLIEFRVEKISLIRPKAQQSTLYLSVQEFICPQGNRIFLFTISTTDLFTVEPFTELDFMHEMISVQDKERENIGSMLHDSVAQILYGIRLNLQHFILTNPEHGERIKDVKELLNGAILQIRNLSKELSLSTLRDYGLKTAIEKMVEKINVPGLKITTQFECESGIPSNYQLTLFKIIQELLNNALKHSGASTIRISQKCRKEMLIIEVRDNGCGIRKDINTFLDHGTGLRTLMKRAELLNGKIVISKRTKGGAVRAEFKIKY